MRSLFVAFLFLVFASSGLFAQKSKAPKSQHRSFNLELLGQSMGYAFNYDFRFNNQIKGFGARFGIGYYNFQGETLLSVPLGVNYLLGRNGKYLELGAGFTVGENILFHSNDFGASGTLCYGLRVQPENGGFNFRANINTAFGKSDGDFFFFPLVPGVSMGYTF